MSVHEGHLNKFLVPMRPGETPVPIPNTMVKAQTADGTMLGTAWESRRLPGFFFLIEKDRKCDTNLYLENCT